MGIEGPVVKRAGVSAAKQCEAFALSAPHLAGTGRRMEPRNALIMYCRQNK
jgi:hypothetical protein